MQKTIPLPKRSLNFRLFPKPSFTEGMARVLDLGGTLQINVSVASPIKTDIDAISRDWQIVGEDIKNSINVYEWKRPTNAR